ncbi:putative cytochrome b561, DM13 and DOMON domain-containing [Sesbania bispinosa]|nr:putative cytochrome b561, DM13 and DOMON domain-containing [Sesbania bispinosa]
MPNVTWNMICVLAVWEVPIASDFGHVVLADSVASSPASSPQSNEREKEGGLARPKVMTIDKFFEAKPHFLLSENEKHALFEF